MENDTTKTDGEEMTNIALPLTLLLCVLLCLGVVYYILTGTNDVQESEMIDTTPAESIDEPEKVERDAEEPVTEFDAQVYILPEDAPSFETLGVSAPPPKSKTEAYDMWVESYQDAYYDYLVEIGEAEAYEETDIEKLDLQGDAYTEYMEQNPEMQN